LLNREQLLGSSLETAINDSLERSGLHGLLVVIDLIKDIECN
jgi:hypothetical protein